MKLFQSLLLTVLFVSAVFFTGCKEEPTTPVPVNTTNLSKLTLPAGAVITSATLNMYVEDPSGNNATVHKVNVAWSEAETWNTFFANPDPEFDPAPLGNFDVTAGLHTVDITALVQAWFAGTTPNYGVLLNQPISADGFGVFRSSEFVGTNQPYLEVTYTVGGGAPVVVQEPAFIDTYIWSIEPDNSFGNEIYLRLAHIDNYRKYVLVQFDIEQEVEVECETAYAFGGAFATCINTLPGVTNWGWTNYITDLSSDFSYEWPIYAGAAQCDVTKGELVGTLHVNYYAAGDSLTVHYAIDGPCYLDETHLWVKEGQPLPIKKLDPLTYTSAPGQFNYNFQNPVTVYNLDEPFYIAAHSVVCCPVE